METVNTENLVKALRAGKVNAEYLGEDEFSINGTSILIRDERMMNGSWSYSCLDFVQAMNILTFHRLVPGDFKTKKAVFNAYKP